jgi:hypothetical protein
VQGMTIGPDLGDRSSHYCALGGRGKWRRCAPTTAQVPVCATTRDMRKPLPASEKTRLLSDESLQVFPVIRRAEGLDQGCD